MKDKVTISFEKWKKRSTDKYINAICKPCWELKYCPYGVLVESFEIRNDMGDPYRCRVFGHLCPVFRVAEPLTETKEHRNISRNISMVTQRRVTRRDNYICQLCKNHIPDDKINFDHIIPWSKGGSSDESNIRLLCESCNKKRGNSFEEQYLIAQAPEVFNDPYAISDEMLKDLLQLFLVALEISKHFSELTEKAFCDVIKTQDTEMDKFMYYLISQLWDLFSFEKFFLPVKKKEVMLKYRWGLYDGCIHSVKETCEKHKTTTDYYLEVEKVLLRQIGLIITDKIDMDNYENFCINNDKIKKAVIAKLCH